MNVATIRFSGRLLTRGFWLYVIDIVSERRRALYVGRTGDSSSAHAGSPFARIGQHLDLRPKAKGNALLRNLQQAGFEPSACELRMVAVGPFYPEQSSFSEHKPIRDRMAGLEKAVAEGLRARGFDVLGKHAARHAGDPAQVQQVVGFLAAELVRAEPPNYWS
jgi:hypothetical protein